jgi:hypothetical protein
MPGDDELRRLFAEAHSAAGGPSFAGTWAAARGRRETRRSFAAPALAVGLLAAIALVATVAVRLAPPPEVAFVSNWRMPTDVLLPGPSSFHAPTDALLRRSDPWMRSLPDLELAKGVPR